MKKRIYSMLIVAGLTFALVACGKQQAEPVVSDTEIAEGNTEEALLPDDSSEPSRAPYTEETKGVINVSINPEVEFEIDEAGKIATVIYVNDDAADAYSELSLEGMDLEEVMGLVVKTADDKGYLKDGHDVTLNYGVTGYASASESKELIETARNAITKSLEETGKKSAVVLQVSNYAQEESDICDLCFGVGMLICDGCGGKSYGNGKVKCDLCDGSGIYDDGHNLEEDNSSADNVGGDPAGACRHCHGTGMQTIQAQTCYTCNGSGLCINCGGSGTELDEQGNPGSCHACGGSGDCLQQVCVGGIMPERHEICRECGGSGLESDTDEPDDSPSHDGEDAPRANNICNRCDGEGFMTCNCCNGELITTCNRCNGTGINKH